jgi:hypothetical protein
MPPVKLAAEMWGRQISPSIIIAASHFKYAKLSEAPFKVRKLRRPWYLTVFPDHGLIGVKYRKLSLFKMFPNQRLFFLAAFKIQQPVNREFGSLGGFKSLGDFK